VRELEEEGEGEKKGGKELEGEDFPGKFRETPRPPDATRTSFAKRSKSHTLSGVITCPLPPLLTPICMEGLLFVIII